MGSSKKELTCREKLEFAKHVMEIFIVEHILITGNITYLV